MDEIVQRIGKIKLYLVGSFDALVYISSRKKSMFIFAERKGKFIENRNITRALLGSF